MFCTRADCKCSKRVDNPGCNVLCACMNETNYCLKKQQQALEVSFHDLSMQESISESIPESIPESPEKRNRFTSTSDSESSASAAAGSSSSSSSVEERTSNQLSDLLDDFENVIPREQVVYSSRRLTEQQILRLNPRDAVTVFIFRDHDDSDPKIGPHFVTFEGYGAIGLDSCFLLRRV